MYNMNGMNSNPYGFGSQQIQKVNGWAGAQAYILPPNSSIILMDKEKDIIYVKASDASGIASITQFKCEPMKAPGEIDTDNFVTKDEFARRCDNIEQLIKGTGSNGNAYQQPSNQASQVDYGRREQNASSN